MLDSPITTAGALLLGALLVCGCSDDRRTGVATAAAAATASTSPTAVSSGGPAAAPAVAPTTSAALSPQGQLTRGLKLAIARRFAPELRFNAFHNDGNGSAQNRHEDFFPSSVSAFLRELTRGQARVSTQGSRGDAPGESEVRPFASQPVLELSRLRGYPRAMVGAPPGSAPFYISVYEDTTARALAPDGSGAITVYVEYWLFYPNDRADVRLLGLIPTGGRFDITGHRADWEQTSFRCRVTLSAGGVFAGGALEEGAFRGHGKGIRVPGPDLETVDDQGRLDPAGTHARVFVSQGKHASYPQAGEWKDHSTPSWVAEHTDFFRGNGVVVSGWRVPLIDLDDPLAEAAALNGPAWRALLAASPSLTPGLFPDWTAYRGSWGPDVISPDGPKAKSYHQGFHLGAVDWSDLKARHARLKVYADLGITIPTHPNPAPIRR